MKKAQSPSDSETKRTLKTPKRSAVTDLASRGPPRTMARTRTDREEMSVIDLGQGGGMGVPPPA